MPKTRQPLAAECVPLGREQRAFELWRTSEAANRSAGRNDPVIRQAWFGRIAKDVTDRSCGTRASGECRDIAISRYLAHRYRGNHAKHPAGEHRGGDHGLISRA